LRGGEWLISAILREINQLERSGKAERTDRSPDKFLQFRAEFTPVRNQMNMLS
jgi:hypothetical protein